MHIKSVLSTKKYLRRVYVCFKCSEQKRRVGKTTVASHLAQALGLIGQKVLVIDNDEQHNLTRTLGITVAEINLADITVQILMKNRHQIAETNVS